MVLNKANELARRLAIRLNSSGVRYAPDIMSFKEKKVEGRKWNSLKKNRKGKHTLDVVTRETLWAGSEMTEKGWIFLRELAEFIQCRYYPNASDKEEMVSRMVLKGAEQVYGYDLKKKEDPEFEVRNWKNFIFTGMRNTASNYQYHANKDIASLDDPENEGMIKHQEEVLSYARENGEDVPEKTESEVRELADSLSRRAKSIIGERFPDSVGLAHDSIIERFGYGNGMTVEERMEQLSGLENDVCEMICVLNDWYM